MTSLVEVVSSIHSWTMVVEAGMMRTSSELATEEKETDVSERTVEPARLAVHIGSYSR